MDSVFDQAISDYFAGKQQGPLLIHNKYGPPDEMDLAAYFREQQDFNAAEIYALSLCRGHILDIGAAAGAMSLALQAAGHDVVALDSSLACCGIMEKQGLLQIRQADLFEWEGEQFNTLLLMMNGLGICGTLARLPLLLDRLKELLAPGGHVLFDSSDVSYLYDKPPSEPYYGEMSYRYEYNGRQGRWFNWLYLDSQTLQEQLAGSDWQLQILYEDDLGHYLGRLTLQ